VTTAAFTPAALTDALLGAADTPTRRAVIVLLAEHDYWLRRIALHHPDLVRTDDGVPFELDWRALGRLVDEGTLIASTSQLAILELAVSLRQARPVDLGRALAALGTANAADAVRAVATAVGREDLVAAEGA
jgi:hypothetical protein